MSVLLPAAPLQAKRLVFRDVGSLFVRADDALAHPDTVAIVIKAGGYQRFVATDRTRLCFNLAQVICVVVRQSDFVG